MNLVNVFVKLYLPLDSNTKFFNKLKSPLRFGIRKIANYLLPKYLSISAKKNTRFTQTDVIVSLTSFPARIESIWIVIECMLRQTYRPKKILLWLSKEQFHSMDSVPKSLIERLNDSFEIHLVDGDIRSHKKYYYVFQQYNESMIFLIDDDIFYPSDIIERSIKEVEQTRADVVCNYALNIEHDGVNLRPYNQWRHQYAYSKEGNLFFGSGGGTLLCPKKLYSDVLKINLALELTPSADDIWLNTMARLGNNSIHVLCNGMILPILIDRNQHLSTKNCSESQNDVQLARVAKYYKEINNKIF